MEWLVHLDEYFYIILLETFGKHAAIDYLSPIDAAEIIVYGAFLGTYRVLTDLIIKFILFTPLISAIWLCFSVLLRKVSSSVVIRELFYSISHIPEIKFRYFPFLMQITMK